MKSISKIALAAALLSGTSAFVATAPAIAKEKKDDAAQGGAGFKFSGPEIIAAIQAAQPAVQANNPAAAEPLVVQVETLVKNDDDRYAAAVLRSQLESQKIASATGAGQPINQAAQLSAYNTLLNSPRTTPDGKAQIAMNLGIIYYNSKQYPQAVTYFTQAQQLGSTEPNLAANLAKAKFYAGDAQGGLAGITTMIDQQTQQKGKADEELYRFALSKTIQAKDGAATLSWMRKYLTAYPTPKNWRDMIKIYGLQQGSFITLSKNQSLDLYRLMRVTGALADEYDYLAYADAANGVGLPWEAKTVITDGRAKGKVPATGTSAQLLALSNTRIAAEGSLASLETKSKAAADGKLASQTADAQLGSGNYAKAAELYRLALQKGGVDASVNNIRLGIALTMGGDKAGAKTAFAAVTGSPSADVAALWATYIDMNA
jgi:Flp pilus assembly protein TadD